MWGLKTIVIYFLSQFLWFRNSYRAPQGSLCLVRYGWKLQRLAPESSESLFAHKSGIWSWLSAESRALAFGQGRVRTVSPCSPGFCTTWWLAALSKWAGWERERSSETESHCLIVTYAWKSRGITSAAFWWSRQLQTPLVLMGVENCQYHIDWCNYTYKMQFAGVPGASETIFQDAPKRTIIPSKFGYKS